MTFKLKLLTLVIVSSLSLHNAQCTIQLSGGLAQLQDPQLAATLKSFETILGLLQEAPKGESVSTRDGKQLGVANLIELAQVNLENCHEDHFRLLVELRKQFDQMPLATYIRNLITKQRRFCEQYLDEQADSKVAAFSEPTRRDFELFLKHDKIGHDFYVSPEVSIVKLREILKLAGDERQQAATLEKGQYVTSCREITLQLEPLVPIRRNHDTFARLPMGCDRFFRAYEFCRNLVDFDFSEELAKALFLDVNSRTEISRFGFHLAPLGRAGYVMQEQALEAARAFARERAPTNRQVAAAMAFANQRMARIIDRLRAACTSSLDLTENLRWLRDHLPRGLEASGARLTSRAVEYLRALEGCEHLVELQADEVLRHQIATTVKPTLANDLVKPSRRSLRMIIRKIFNLGSK